jgi:hypothetical protein
MKTTRRIKLLLGMLRAYTKKYTNSRTGASIGATREQLLEQQRNYQALLDSERSALMASVDVTPAAHPNPAAHPTSLYFHHKYPDEREHQIAGGHRDGGRRTEGLFLSRSMEEQQQLMQELQTPPQPTNPAAHPTSLYFHHKYPDEREHQIAGGHRDGGGRTEGHFLSGSMEEQQQLMQELQTPPQPTNTPQAQQGLVARASHPFKMGADVLEMALFTRSPAVGIYDQSMQDGGSALVPFDSGVYARIGQGDRGENRWPPLGPFHGSRPSHAQVTDYPLSEYLSRGGNAHASLHVATTNSTNMNSTSFTSSLPSSQSLITELSTR